MLLVLCHLLCILISIAYYTLSERKMIAAIQSRQGPQIVGFLGLLQPMADGLKVLVKEVIIPRTASTWLFILAPAYMFVISLITWCFIPISPLSMNMTKNMTATFYESYFVWNVFVNSPLNLLLFLAISSLGIYGMIFSGWASNSKYAVLGTLRSAAQMMSYEVSLSLLLIPVLLFSESANFMDIIESQKLVWNMMPLFPIAMMFFICGLAETNRTPFDLPEAEAELVAGYNVDYSALPFALFFLGEYSNMLLMSSLNAMLFWGGWYMLPFGSTIITNLNASIMLGSKMVIISLMFVLVRAILPSYRYDQLMFIQWKMFLPYSMLFIMWLMTLKLFYFLM